jgi:hypothetical protein
MNIAELKLEIIAKIIATDDVEILLKVKALLEQVDIENSNEQSNFISEPDANYGHLTTEHIRVFSTEEQSKINRALAQYKNGECISDEEAQKEIQEWLKD